MSKWKKGKLGEICSKVCSGGTPDSKNRSFYGGDIPWLNTKEVDFGRIYRTENTITEEGLNNSAAKWVEANSIVIAMYGNTAGKSAVTKIPLTTNQACCNLTIDKDKADFNYVFYCVLKSYQELASMANGAAQKNLNAQMVKGFEIPLPPLSTQHRIATILSRYDSLIENYQKQIKLLEEAAQRLYKEWFIDLHFPGHEKSNIIDGVPEGWEKKKIGDIVKTTSGGTPSRSKQEYYTGNNLWVKTKELCDGFVFDTEEKITEEAINCSSAKLIPEGSLLMAMYGATIGKLGVATKVLTCNQACCVFLFDENNNVTKWFLYNWLLLNREYLVSQGKGAAQPNLSQDMIKRFELLIPCGKIISSYNDNVNGLYGSIKSLQSQLRLLTEARDRLLPKLMSGEIEV